MGKIPLFMSLVNPVARTRATAQLIAFAVYGAFAAVCIALYLKKGKKAAE